MFNSGVTQSILQWNCVQQRAARTAGYSVGRGWTGKQCYSEEPPPIAPLLGFDDGPTFRLQIGAKHCNTVPHAS